MADLKMKMRRDFPWVWFGFVYVTEEKSEEKHADLSI